MPELLTKTNIKLEGQYKINSHLLEGLDSNITLKIGMRHRPKRGQAKRFIGLINDTEPESEQFTYISSLYAVQGTRNTYELEYEKQRFVLTLTDIGTVTITEKTYEPPLVFID